MVARQHHAVWLLLIASASVNTWGTHAFVGPFPSFSSRSRQLASSYYDGMDYTARRNKEQEKYETHYQSKSPWYFRSFMPLTFLTCQCVHYTRPDWAGGGPISSVVSALINNKFLYNFMKIGARKVGRDSLSGNRRGCLCLFSVLLDQGRRKDDAWGPTCLRFYPPGNSSSGKVLIENAERKGVAWRKDAEALLKDRRLPNTFSRHFGVSHASEYSGPLFPFILPPSRK